MYPPIRDSAERTSDSMRCTLVRDTPISGATLASLLVVRNVSSPCCGPLSVSLASQQNTCFDIAYPAVLTRSPEGKAHRQKHATCTFWRGFVRARKTWFHLKCFLAVAEEQGEKLRLQPNTMHSASMITLHLVWCLWRLYQSLSSIRGAQQNKS
jgi:hypothetical protein